MTADDVRVIFEVYACYLANPQADPEAQPELRFDQDVGAILMAQRDLIVALSERFRGGCREDCDGLVMHDGGMSHSFCWQSDTHQAVWRTITQAQDAQNRG